MAELTILLDDGSKHQLNTQAARGSAHFMTFIEECNVADPIPVPNIKVEIYNMIAEYLRYYRILKPNSIPKPLPSKRFSELVTEWEFKFTDIELPIIFQLLIGASYLQIHGLVELCSAKVASEIRGRGVDEIRAIFNIQNDFTADEERKIREESKWCEID